MDVTNDDYIRLLSALLPPGPAWSASDPAIAGAAPSLTRVHQRADALMRELDPRTTTELINRWERLCGLPDECIPAGTQTLRQRQQRLDAKVNLAGGINENFYLAQLAALGRPDATITRYDKSTFTCSSACTDAVNAPEWRYYWQVNMPAATNTTWMTCGDPCDSALRIWGDTVVECVRSARVRTVLPVVTPRLAHLPPISMMTTLICCRRSFAAWWRHPVPAWRRGETTSCLPRFVLCC